MESRSIASGSASSDRPRQKGSKLALNNKRRKPRNDQRLANYLVFGLQSTLCLGAFVICYALVLIILWPLLQASTPESMPEERPQDYIHHLHVPPSLQENVHLPRAGEMTSGLRKKLSQFRQGRGVTDAQLMDQAVAEFDAQRKARSEHEAAAEKQRQELEALSNANNADRAKDGDGDESTKRNGFVVLGMHRSGTSMLSGLLHQSAGYEVGG
ncbi:MAG: hypothetical protein SGARI_007629, partial [Bacillariaceae sp.]